MSIPISIPFAQALQIVGDVASQRATATQEVGLREARGRVLREALHAPMALPSFANSAMDGFAVRGADLSSTSATRLRLVGTRYAGSTASAAIGAGECLRVTTGAPLPQGADTVVIKEHARVDGEHVELQPGTATGTHVRAAGEDVERGTALFAAGATLRAPALGLLASLGIGRVAVATRPSVAVFTSGDELRPLGTELAFGQIFDSNRVLLQALLADEGIDTLAWPPLADDEARIAGALDDAAQAYDLILTCGGVSAGEKDLLPALLSDRGETYFWKVLMRPGMPVLFGRWGGSLLLGLPGNPVSVLATFRRLARPLLDALQGRTDRAPSLRARLLAPVQKSHARLEFRRARISCDAEGQLGVRPHPAAGSHQQLGAAHSNALMVLPEDSRALEPGAIVDVEPYGDILRT